MSRNPEQKVDCHQHYIQSGMDINPMIGAPIVWHPVLVQS